ncbi:[Pyruvate dehydrogenase (acetyl-transferring)] kinase isozyme 2 [Trichinella pseudospiralis]
MLPPVTAPVNQLFACYLTDAKRRSRVSGFGCDHLLWLFLLQTDRKTRDPIFNRIDTVFLAILMRMTKFQKKKMYRSSSRRDSWQQSTDRVISRPIGMQA